MEETAEVDGRLTALRERARQGIASFLAPLTGWLDTLGVTANRLTWVGFWIAVVAAFLAGFRVFIAAGIIYLIAGVVDLLDGALARRADTASARGAFLDSGLDRAAEGAIHAGAAVAFAYWGVWIGVLAVVLSLAGGYLTSYARARAEGLGIELPEVWFGRGERLVLLALGLIFHFALIAFWILAVVGWLSAARRARLAWRRLALVPEVLEGRSPPSASEPPLTDEPLPPLDEPPLAEPPSPDNPPPPVDEPLPSPDEPPPDPDRDLH
ncbi:MAG: CDP-alcohol phosphatidyltransferase family protein [Gammaproteobacteria bacterium]